MATPRPLRGAQKLLRIIDNDELRLERVDQYHRGIQTPPYTPVTADNEYRDLTKRSTTNVMPFIVRAATQAMYVDSFLRGVTNANGERTASVPKEWDHFQRSGMDAKQHSIYDAAFIFGHSFVLTEKDARTGKAISRGLSSKRTAALYANTATDTDPTLTLTITKSATEKERGEAWLWDEKNRYPVRFKSLADANSVTVLRGQPHGAGRNPVTRFAAMVDLEGRTTGVIEPMIPVQDRLNQSVFDLLMAQSYSSNKIRTVSGMAPPVKMQPEYEDGEIVGWVPVIGDDGRPIPDDIAVNAKRMFWAEDPDVKFGTLDETPLGGFIDAIDLSFRHMAALSQTPPHYILGQIANLSAEAMIAAETALARKIEAFKVSFGESWERVFRVAAEIEGNAAEADDFSGEVQWRDMEQRSLVQVGDALSKLKDLGIPLEGLWGRVPGVTATELARWRALAEQEDSQARLASAIEQATLRASVSTEDAETEAA